MTGNVDQPPEPSSGFPPPQTEEDWLARIRSSTSQENPKTSDTEVDAPPDTSGATRKVDSLEEQQIEDQKANRSLREKYAEKAYKLAAGCISMWTVLLGAQGVVKAVIGVEMWSEKVIIAVTTGVTVSVLAAFLGVIRGLFPNGQAKDSKNSEK